MLSDFDREDIDAIIRKEKPDYDRFTAHLLQFLARCPYFLSFDTWFSEEVNAVIKWREDGNSVEWYHADELTPEMERLWSHADMSNMGLLLFTGLFNDKKYIESYEREQQAMIEILGQMIEF